MSIPGSGLDNFLDDEPQQGGAVSAATQVPEVKEKNAYAAIDRYVAREPVAEGDAQIPAIAYRLLPSPQSTDAHFKKICPSGYYDLAPSNEAQEAIAAQLHHMSPEEELALKHVFVQWLYDRQGIDFSSDGFSLDDLITTSGTAGDIDAVSDIFDQMKEGKARFATITPTYPPILSPSAPGGKYEGRFATVAMEDTKDGWKLDMDKLKETLAQTDVFVMCNPTNPNGYVFSNEELTEIVRECKKNGVKIIADEVWADQVNQFTSIAAVAAKEDYKQGVVTLYGVGKTFGTAAFPVSTALIADAHVREKFEEQQSKKDFSDPFDHPKTSKEAALAAIDCMQGDGPEYIKQLNALVKANIDYCVPLLNKLGFKTHTPAGTSVIFARVSETANDDEIQHAAALFEAAGIEVKKSMGVRYGMDGYIRLNMGCPTAMVKARYDKLAQLAQGGEVQA